LLVWKLGVAGLKTGRAPSRLPFDSGPAGFVAQAGDRAADWHLLQRVGSLAALLVVEFGAFRMWLDTIDLQGASALTTFVVPKGPGTFRFAAVRLVVAFAMVSLIFGESKATNRFRRVFDDLAPERIARPLLFVHLGLAVLFAGLSSILFGTRLPAALNIGLATLWIAVGLGACGSAAVAFVPAAFWSQLFRRMRHVLTFALVISVGAYAVGRLAVTFWPLLSHGTMGVAYAMLHPFVPTLSADPSRFTIGTQNFQVEIAEGCSGYEGLGLMLVFMVAWLWFHRTEWRFPHALVLIPLSLIGIWIINCVRVAALVLIGIAGAPDIALGGFHSQAGWLGLTAVALGICLVARRVPFLLKNAEVSHDSRSSASNPTAVFLIPFLATLAGAMIAQLGSAGFEWLYPIRVVACAGALCYFGRNYRAFDWRIGWTSIGVGGLVFVVWVSLEPLVSPASPVGIPMALGRASEMGKLGWLAFRVFGAVITVPIAEELAFRGFLLRRFDSDDFQSVRWRSVSWLAIGLSSLAFGVLHGERWLAGTIAGLVYAKAFLRRGSIGDATAAHATTNALIAGWVLYGGHWQLW
jgi:exosortase E/protease (VPEID-CTERM system)